MTITQHAHIYSFHTSNFNLGEISENLLVKIASDFLVLDTYLWVMNISKNTKWLLLSMLISTDSILQILILEKCFF